MLYQPVSLSFDVKYIQNITSVNYFNAISNKFALETLLF